MWLYPGANFVHRIQCAHYVQWVTTLLELELMHALSVPVNAKYAAPAMCAAPVWSDSGSISAPALAALLPVPPVLPILPVFLVLATTTFLEPHVIPVPILQTASIVNQILIV